MRVATLRRRARLAEVFTPRELRMRILAPSGLRLIQPLDRRLSRRSWQNVRKLSTDGRLLPAAQEYPMILMAMSRSLFTSVCLVMQKPGSR
jgi:hypothetical protein